MSREMQTEMLMIEGLQSAYYFLSNTVITDQIYMFVYNNEFFKYLSPLGHVSYWHQCNGSSRSLKLTYFLSYLIFIKVCRNDV